SSLTMSREIVVDKTCLAIGHLSDQSVWLGNIPPSPPSPDQSVCSTHAAGLDHPSSTVPHQVGAHVPRIASEQVSAWRCGAKSASAAAVYAAGTNHIPRQLHAAAPV